MDVEFPTIKKLYRSVKNASEQVSQAEGTTSAVSPTNSSQVPLSTLAASPVIPITMDEIFAERGAESQSQKKQKVSDSSFLPSTNYAQRMATLQAENLKSMEVKKEKIASARNASSSAIPPKPASQKPSSITIDSSPEGKSADPSKRQTRSSTKLASTPPPRSASAPPRNEIREEAHFDIGATSDPINKETSVFDSPPVTDQQFVASGSEMVANDPLSDLLQMREEEVIILRNRVATLESTDQHSSTKISALEEELERLRADNQRLRGERRNPRTSAPRTSNTTSEIPTASTLNTVPPSPFLLSMLARLGYLTPDIIEDDFVLSMTGERREEFINLVNSFNRVPRPFP